MKLKCQDKICLENILLCNNLSPSVFNAWFSFSWNVFSLKSFYETWSSAKGNLIKLFYNTKRYGECSIAVSAMESWNKIQKQKIFYSEIYPPIKLKQLSAIFILNHINNSLIMQKLHLILIRGIIAIINYTY